MSFNFFLNYDVSSMISLEKYVVEIILVVVNY